jgi:hypothetical protein
LFRKIAIALLAAASIAAVAPSAASAHGMGGHGGRGMHMGGYGGHWGGNFRHGRFYRSSFFVGGGSCYKTIFTELGPQRVNVCNVY